MAKIKLSDGGFQIVPEGKHIFKVTAVDYDEDFGKMKVQLVTADGITMTEQYNLLTSDGEVNEKANNAFSYFAKTALNNFNLDEIDSDDLVGCYFKATCTHDKVPSTKDPAKTVIFARLSDREPASGFDKAEKAVASTPAKSGSKTKVNLDDILG